MQNNKVIIPTGYMGSGSSVITDLVSEFEGFEASKGSFEYVFLHCPNGVFDLEDKLLIGNNAIRSDEALHSFYFTMKQLYDKKYWWVGNYKKLIGKKFWNLTERYIKELIEYKPSFYWYFQENTNVRMFFQLIVKKFVKLISLNRIELKKPLLYSPMWISYIQPDKFYAASKKYIYGILQELGLSEKNIILDQLLLPFNLFRLEKYFNDDVEVFVVQRDPRDMFLMNKYIWPAQNGQVPYPTDAKEFCECYKRLREMELKSSSKHIHRFQFEDFIYKYEETIEQVQKALSNDGIVPKHVLKRNNFIPEKSINNTQLFVNETYKEETEIIEKMLSEYLYDFPYERVPDKKEMF